MSKTKSAIKRAFTPKQTMSTKAPKKASKTKVLLYSYIHWIIIAIIFYSTFKIMSAVW